MNDLTPLTPIEALLQSAMDGKTPIGAFMKAFVASDVVLLNKADTASTFEVSRYLQPGTWRDALGGDSRPVKRSLKADVPAHGVKVYVLDAAVNQKELQAELAKAVADQQERTQRLSR